MALVLLIIGFLLGVLTVVNNPEIGQKAGEIQDSLINKFMSKEKDDSKKEEASSKSSVEEEEDK